MTDAFNLLQKREIKCLSQCYLLLANAAYKKTEAIKIHKMDYNKKMLRHPENRKRKRRIRRIKKWKKKKETNKEESKEKAK